MVRESRLLWNDFSDDRFRERPPVELDDDSDDWDESPLDPPPQRRCTRRGRPCRSKDDDQIDPSRRSPVHPDPSTNDGAA